MQLYRSRTMDRVETARMLVVPLLVVVLVAAIAVWWYRNRTGGETDIVGPANGEVEEEATPVPIPSVAETPTEEDLAESNERKPTTGGESPGDPGQSTDDSHGDDSDGAESPPSTTVSRPPPGTLPLLPPTLPERVELSAFPVRFHFSACVTPRVSCTALKQSEKAECRACDEWLDHHVRFEPSLSLDRDAYRDQPSREKPSRRRGKGRLFLSDAVPQMYGVPYPETSDGSPVPIRDFFARRKEYGWREVPAEQEPSGAVAVWPDQGVGGLFSNDYGADGALRAEVLYPSERHDGALHRAPIGNLTAEYGPPVLLVPEALIQQRAERYGQASGEQVAWIDSESPAAAQQYWGGFTSDLGAMAFHMGTPALDAAAAIGLSEIAAVVEEHPELDVVVTAGASDQEAMAAGITVEELSARRVASIRAYLGAHGRGASDIDVIAAPAASCRPEDTGCIRENGRIESRAIGVDGKKRGLQWSSWVEYHGVRVTDPAEVEETYSVKFLLSPADIEALRTLALLSTPVSKELAEVKGRTVSLKLLPVLIGRALDLEAGEQRIRRITVDLDKLAAVQAPPRDWTVEQLQAWARRVTAETVDTRQDDGRRDDRAFEVVVNAAREGCGGVALSIWKGNLSRPLDYIYQPVPVAKPCPDSPVSAAALTAERMRPLTALAGRQVGGALHVFEIDSKKSRAVAVFHAEGSDSLLAWELATPVRGLLSVIEAEVMKAHKAKPPNLSETSQLLAREMFSAATPADKLLCQQLPTATPERGREGQLARRFVECLSECADPRHRPMLFAKLQLSTGEGAFLPLGLLQDGTGTFVSTRVDVVQPLHRESYDEASTCIPSDRWHFVYPTAKALGQQELDHYYLPIPARFEEQVSRDWPKLKDVMTVERRKAPDSSLPPEAVLLLAHHDNDGIYFIENNAGEKVLAGGVREFGAGSVAILAACSVAGEGAQWGGAAWTSRLGNKGVHTTILTPFRLPFSVGVRFTGAFMKRLADAYDEGRDVSVLQLLAETAQSLEKDTDLAGKGVAAYEFMLAGNADLRICGSKNVGAP